MLDKLSRELELFRKMRALIKQAEVEARLAGSRMVEAEHLPAAMAAVPFGPDPGRDGCAPTDSSNASPHPPISTHQPWPAQRTVNDTRTVMFTVNDTGSVMAK